MTDTATNVVQGAPTEAPAQDPSSLRKTVTRVSNANKRLAKQNEALIRMVLMQAVKDLDLDPAEAIDLLGLVPPSVERRVRAVIRTRGADESHCDEETPVRRPISIFRFHLAEGEAKAEQITRKLLFVMLEDLGIDPTSDIGLNVIDNYRPDMDEMTVDEAFTDEAILAFIAQSKESRVTADTIPTCPHPSRIPRTRGCGRSFRRWWSPSSLRRGAAPIAVLEGEKETETGDLQGRLLAQEFDRLGLDPDKGVGKAVAITFDGEPEELQEFVAEEFGFVPVNPVVPKIAASYAALDGLSGAAGSIQPPTEADELAHAERRGDTDTARHEIRSAWPNAETELTTDTAGLRAIGPAQTECAGLEDRVSGQPPRQAAMVRS